MPAERNVITIGLQGTDLDEAEVFGNVLTEVNRPGMSGDLLI